MNSSFGKATGALALIAALGLGTAPLQAQQQQQQTPGNLAAPSVSDNTVQRTGAAIRDISNIQARFNQRMQGAQPSEQEAIEREANSAAEAALSSRGLSVEEYNNVIRLAQADPSLRDRLVSAARTAR